MRPCLILAFFLLLCGSCANIRSTPKYELGKGKYLFKQGRDPYKQVHAFVVDDSLKIFDLRDGQEVMQRVTANSVFLKRSLDIDVSTIPFKYRPSVSGLPRQLTTDFNGNLYIGYRIDRFETKRRKTPVGIQPEYFHRGITMGMFMGLGSTAVTPWTTDNAITEEYNGLILSRGLAAMVAANNLTVGVGIGFDYLTDRDKDVWIYQNKPWYGLILGLNIN